MKALLFRIILVILIIPWFIGFIISIVLTIPAWILCGEDLNEYYLDRTDKIYDLIRDRF